MNQAAEQTDIDVEDDVVINEADTAKEPEGKEPEDQGTDKPVEQNVEPEATDEAVEAKTDDKPETEDNDDDEVHFDDKQQEHLNKIIGHNKNKAKIQNLALKEQLLAEQAEREKWQKLATQQTNQGQEVRKKLEEEGLLEGDLGEAAKFEELPPIPQQQTQTVQAPAGVKLFDTGLSQQQDYYETLALRGKYEEKFPGKIDQAVATLGQLVGVGRLPRDVLNLAARRDDGAEILDKIVTDQDFTNKLIIAGYDSGTLDEYALKFNDIVGKIDTHNGKPKKLKPVPNETLESRPSNQGKPESETVWVD